VPPWVSGLVKFYYGASGDLTKRTSYTKCWSKGTEAVRQGVVYWPEPYPHANGYAPLPGAVLPGPGLGSGRSHTFHLVL